MKTIIYLAFAVVVPFSIFAQDIHNENFGPFLNIPGTIIRATDVPNAMLIFNGLFEEKNVIYVNVEKIQTEGQKDKYYYQVTNSGEISTGEYVFYYYKSIDDFRTLISVIVDLSTKAKIDSQQRPSELVTYYYTFDGKDKLRVYLDFGYVICEYYIEGKRALFISGYEKIMDFAKKSSMIIP